MLAGRVHRRFRDKVTIALEAHVATLQASMATIAHQEVRGLGIGQKLMADRRCAWAIFGGAYVGAVVFVAVGLRSTAGNVLLGFLRGFWAYGARRLSWLEDYAASLVAGSNHERHPVRSRIVRVDGSRVVEVGTHEALIAKRGQYADLYSIQAAAYR